MSHSTAEAGELSPRDPVEGRGHRQVAPVEGKTANTPRLGPVSTSRQRIAELARQALGMAVAIAWLPGPAGTRRRVAKPSVEEPDAAEPARPDLWGARVSNDPGLPDRHWVLVVMDQYTRRIVGFGIHAGIVDGRALCRMFNHAIRGLSRPKRLSSDHDPLYRFHHWCANLRVLQVTEVKSVPYVPLSHPFVERLIGTLRRECVDQMLFWSASDLEHKLVAFQDFYNAHRAHASLEGRTPVPTQQDVALLTHYRWDEHCRGLYQTPIAA